MDHVTFEEVAEKGVVSFFRRSVGTEEHRPEHLILRGRCVFGGLVLQPSRDRVDAEERRICATAADKEQDDQSDKSSAKKAPLHSG